MVDSAIGSHWDDRATEALLTENVLSMSPSIVGKLSTLRRLMSCCSRFCFRNWMPSSSRRRRISLESSPTFLYRCLWADICRLGKKTIIKQPNPHSKANNCTRFSKSTFAQLFHTSLRSMNHTQCLHLVESVWIVFWNYRKSYANQTTSNSAHNYECIVWK